MAKEKTNLYLLSIVAIVAIVGIVVLVLNSGGVSVSSDDLTGQAITTAAKTSSITISAKGSTTGEISPTTPSDSCGQGQACGAGRCCQSDGSCKKCS